MEENLILNLIRNHLPFTPNSDQDTLLARLSEFLMSVSSRRAFLLTGYAGTGKTSVIAALVKAMKAMNMPFVLLAPTGRAAKVMSHYADTPAFTIHKWIYRASSSNPYGSRFTLADNRAQKTLYIVDEAGMIGDGGESLFGTGSLLSDLLRFVYTSYSITNSDDNGNSLLLLGDTAQLPPVGSDRSPALDAKVLASYGLTLTTATLTQVARQALDSSILANATAIRQSNQVSITSGNDLTLLKPQAFQETLEQAYRDSGMAETIILTRSNRRTNLYNQGVRNAVLFREEAISGGDRLMIVRNNYFWTKDYQAVPFLANGDTAEIKRLRNEREMYGFRFVDASLRLLDYEFDIDATLWLDTLTLNSPEDNYQLQRTLYERIKEDYPDIKNKKELNEEIRKSPYYNALQVRFAYAVTCHKAQGGQWEQVFIDAGLPLSLLNQDLASVKWVYTALTRAKKKVYWLSFPEPKE